MKRIRNAKAKWKAALPEETAFWDSYIASHGEAWGGDFTERMDPAFPLQPYLLELISLPKGATVRILDVGAGPLTYVGKVSSDWPIDLVAVDPLADAYDQLLHTHGVEPPVRTRRGAAENLSALFAENTFDIVTARNALDHCVNPIKAILEMIAVCKPGGVVTLHHAINEAERQGHFGLHQWNFYAKEGDFFISGGRRRVNMTRRLADCATVRNETFGEEWINTVMVKKAERRGPFAKGLGARLRAIWSRG